MGTEPYQTQQDARRAIFNLPEWFPTFRRIKAVYGLVRADIEQYQLFKMNLSKLFKCFTIR